MNDIKTAPKDGSIILIHRGSEGPPVAGFWHGNPMVKWWQAVAGGWVNSVEGWEPFPTDTAKEE
jgi:hypothetical protein